MNAVFGVGWLGQSLGWEDVGTFTKVSESLPLDVDHGVFKLLCHDDVIVLERLKRGRAREEVE
eukprot:scaffold15897_cov105-Skeletonema_dohrnii-CCMP3373.AAC.1